MAWSGGTFTRANGATEWQDDAALGVGIEAAIHDAQDNDLASGINNCLTKDGQNTPTANLPMGGYKHTGVASATASGQYTTYNQLQDSTFDLTVRNIAVNSTNPSTQAISASLYNGATTDPFILTFNKSRGATVGTNTIVANGDVIGRIDFKGANGTGFTTACRIEGQIEGTPGATNDMPGALIFRTCADGTATASERMRITNAGNVLINTTTYTGFIAANTAGIAMGATGDISLTADGAAAVFVNRKTNDGNLQVFYQDGVQEGAISVAGTTVTYGAFCGSHWTQLSDNSKPTIPVGTVMESINQMCSWPGEVEERLPKVKISDTVKSKAVYGVFLAWDNDWSATNDMSVASLGAYFVRVSAGTVLQIGDLLESAGNGMAQVQADDIIRSSTIGKVTALTQSYIEADGSFCVPTVLYCG